jgi:demethylmenaquinone methyltransferase / 2-methoxy-6-polyprenyl-1,4-benzoquinol methylase
LPRATDVRNMFDRIVGRYDLLNTLLSAGRDRAWRQALRRAVAERKPAVGLDLCCGTGDVALELKRGVPGLELLVAADFSFPMCREASRKFARCNNPPATCCADGLLLPFADQSFDFVSVAFGVRNFESLNAGLAEIARIIRPGGMTAILEFAPPRGRFLKALYKPYLSMAIPLAGKIVSGDSGAYQYLASSIQSFLPPEQMTECLLGAGFQDPKVHKLSFGVTCLYTASR